ncbi:hypothetical protein BWQ96_02543 [Gracilariopsis chorda]|uniref:Uncharacterized protein n=1 Tax=Gracilariopsis chorda TaxID=448386 RepID=A0A2V3IZV7_9FLOR|nr:hypothetical protein BWQ96_02543 [Gracilariopsis chorda]|eukprot:PXF47681.1 hypothetical protein BWQ96_02543 [Gracilariopsis chorda]
MKHLPFGTRVYVMWLVLLLLAVLPSFFHVLRPLWRIVAALGPLILALDIDAGNHSGFYSAKFTISLIFALLSLPLVYETSGFEQITPFFRAVVPVLLLLFIASCATTMAANRRRSCVWVGKTKQIHTCNNLFPIDKCLNAKPYADYPSLTIRTPLTPAELRGAWVRDSECGRRMLSVNEVRARVLYICFVTQFVMQRIFKSPQNQVYVFSLVAWYRMRVLLLLAAIAGFIDVFDGLFRGSYADSDVMSKAILWLTLPSITVPAILRIYFGNKASLKLMFYGFLPVSSDRELWLRLGVQPRDLYTALTNGVRAGRVLKETVGLINGAGVGNVKVENLPDAVRASEESLIRLGDLFVRVFDGMRFEKQGGSLRILSARYELIHQNCNDSAASDSIQSNDVDEEEKELVGTGWDRGWETDGGVLEASEAEWEGSEGDKRVEGEGERQWWRWWKKLWRRRDGMTQDVRKQLRRLIADAFSKEEIEEDEYERLTESVTVDSGRRSDVERLSQIVAGAFWRGHIDWVEYRLVSQPLERRLAMRFIFRASGAKGTAKGIEGTADDVEDESANV